MKIKLFIVFLYSVIILFLSSWVLLFLIQLLYKINRINRTYNKLQLLLDTISTFPILRSHIYVYTLGIITGIILIITWIWYELRRQG